MAKRQKTNPVKKILVVAGVLIVAQTAYLLFFGGGDAHKNATQAIAKAVDKRGLTGNKAESAKVQAAVMTYRAQKGRFPNSLNDLKPDFLDRIPIDPVTSQQIAYRLEDGKPIIGTPEEQPVVFVAGVDGDQPLTQSERDALIATLSQDMSKASFVYSAAGKRDPFLPFDFTPKVRPGATPLEQFTFDQLKVTAILGSGDNPAAIIEDATGQGFTVRKGTVVGPNQGQIIEILPDRVVILEVEEDFTGAKQSRTLEMPLRAGE